MIVAFVTILLLTVVTVNSQVSASPAAAEQQQVGILSRTFGWFKYIGATVAEKVTGVGGSLKKRLLRSKTDATDNASSQPSSESPPKKPKKPKLPPEVADALQKRFLDDLDKVLNGWSLKANLDDVKGISSQVTGNEGKAKWKKVKRDPEKTTFEGKSKVKTTIEITFNVHISYKYVLRGTYKREGTTSTDLRDQRVTIQATLLHTDDDKQCYIRSLQIEYPRIIGSVEFQSKQNAHLGVLPGGVYSNRKYSETRTDFEYVTQTSFAKQAEKTMGDYLAQQLDSKLCKSSPPS